MSVRGPFRVLRSRYRNSGSGNSGLSDEIPLALQASFAARSDICEESCGYVAGARETDCYRNLISGRREPTTRVRVTAEGNGRSVPHCAERLRVGDRQGYETTLLVSKGVLAVRMGFEPMDAFQRLRISNATRSARLRHLTAQ